MDSIIELGDKMGYKEDVLIMNFLEKHGIRPYTRIKDIPSYSYFKELLAEFLKESKNVRIE